jgi:TonB family protein
MARAKMSNEKILVVEFEENSLNSLYQILKTEGFEVVTAKDGHEGLLKFESENPDLVIMEPMLLKLHGFDLCRKISKDSRRKTPVIITTGFYKGDHYKSEALDTFGAAAFFEKPYDNKDLLRTIHNLLGNGTGERIENIKESTIKKKASEIDIEATVREMEKSLKEPVLKQEEPGRTLERQRTRKGEAEISSAVDELLQGALSEFGLSIDKKSAEKKRPKEEKKVEKIVEEIPPMGEMESGKEDQTVEAKQSEIIEEYDEEKELQTEELIEELIRKEEEIEEEERPETELVTHEQKEEVEVKKDEADEEVRVEQSETEQKVFGDYFEQSEKSSFLQSVMGFFRKLRKPIPLMIASTVVIVLVAIGATLYFLKPGNKPQTLSSQKTSQPLSSTERTSTNPGDLGNPASLPETQGEGEPEATPGGTAAERTGNNPSQKLAATAKDGEEENVPESTAEFMSVTSLSSNKRQVMLPPVEQSPASREFEVVEVQEADIEELTESDFGANTTPLEETAKRIIQPENLSERIKTGDLVPIESVDLPPVATEKTNPKYPAYAFQRGIEATVVFRALISEFGNVLDIAFVDTSRSATPFNKACEDAVRKWKFTPAKKNGVNVKVWKTFSISFKKNKTE